MNGELSLEGKGKMHMNGGESLFLESYFARDPGPGISLTLLDQHPHRATIPGMDEGGSERQESPVVNPEAMKQEFQSSDSNITEMAEPAGQPSSQKATEIADESTRLRELLQADIRDQDDLERDIGRQVRAAICGFLASIELTSSSG